MMQVFFLLPWMLSGFNQRLQRCQLQKSSLHFVVKTCKNNFLEFTICRYLSYVLPSQPANLQNSPAPAQVCRATETLAYKHCTCTAKTSKDQSLKRSFEAPKAPFEAFRLAFDQSVSAVASRLALFAIKVRGWRCFEASPGPCLRCPFTIFHAFHGYRFSMALTTCDYYNYEC